MTVLLKAVNLLKCKSCGELDADDVSVGTEDEVLHNEVAKDELLVNDLLEVEIGMLMQLKAM